MSYVSSTSVLTLSDFFPPISRGHRIQPNMLLLHDGRLSNAPTLPTRTRGRVPLPMLNPHWAEATAAPASAPLPPLRSCHRRPASAHRLEDFKLLHSFPRRHLPLWSREGRSAPPSLACRSMAVSWSPTTGERMQSKEEMPQCCSQGSRHRDETAPMWVADWSGIGLKICRRNASGRSEMHSSSNPTHRHTLSASSMIRREWPAGGSPWARAGNQMYSEGGRKYTGEEGSDN
jgi:hypothetical protein